MSTETLTYADVATGINSAIAAYAQALDAAEVNEVVDLFSTDGSFEIVGAGAVAAGGEALRDTFAGFISDKPWRHVMVNTLLTSWTDDVATASSDLIFLQQGDSGWAIAMVGRYQDVLHQIDGTWLFRSRELTFAQ